MNTDIILYITAASPVIVMGVAEVIRHTIPIIKYSRWGNNPNSIQIGNIDIQELESVAGQLDTRDYVNWANGIAHEFREPHQRCREITDSTLEVSLLAMEQLADREHARNVRGAVYVPYGVIGHQYLQIFENEEWVPYETTLFTPRLSPNELRSYSEETRDAKSKIELPVSSKQEAHARTMRGTQTWYPTLKSIVEGSIFNN